jgi:hypothetical protein
VDPRLKGAPTVGERSDHIVLGPHKEGELFIVDTFRRKKKKKKKKKAAGSRWVAVLEVVVSIDVELTAPQPERVKITSPDGAVLAPVAAAGASASTSAGSTLDDAANNPAKVRWLVSIPDQCSFLIGRTITVYVMSIGEDEVALRFQATDSAQELPIYTARTYYSATSHMRLVSRRYPKGTRVFWKAEGTIYRGLSAGRVKFPKHKFVGSSQTLGFDPAQVHLKKIEVSEGSAPTEAGRTWTFVHADQQPPHMEWLASDRLHLTFQSVLVA